MFQSFSGSSRRPRQVNLSGRNAVNTTSPSPHTAASVGPQNTLATAQQERRLRQQERDRLLAARKIQRRWRGYRSRKHVRSVWTQRWDHNEQSLLQSRSGTQDGSLGSTSDLEAAWSTDVILLLHFADPKDEDDQRRLQRLTGRILKAAAEDEVDFRAEKWRVPLSRLVKLSISATRSRPEPPLAESQLKLLIFLAQIIPTSIVAQAKQYYRCLRELTLHDKVLGGNLKDGRTLLLTALLAPLQIRTAEHRYQYEAFVIEYLTSPRLDEHLGGLDELASALDYALLLKTMASVVRRDSTKGSNDALHDESRLWLLAYTIYFHERRRTLSKVAADVPEPDYITVLSTLLCSLADEIDRRLPLQDVAMVDRQLEDEAGPTRSGNRHHRVSNLPLPRLVRDNILSLINQRSITSLLAQMDDRGLGRDGSKAPSDVDRKAEARLIASYALTLLRIFPRRADEIRMWLYLGFTSSSSGSSAGSPGRLPAIKYFWNASRNTKVFATITRDSRSAVDLISPKRLRSDAHVTSDLSEAPSAEDVDEDWRIILLFFELYTFVLKVMDDEEFFSTQATPRPSFGDGISSSWTRESALPLSEVRELTVFLKNLAFTLYWNVAELNDVRESETTDGFQSYLHSFSKNNTSAERQNDYERKAVVPIAGMTGMTIEYVKGIVTGLLRMIYERDSRRRFLSKAHWLMTERFDMQGFIPDVVIEEESRHRVQEAEDEEDEADDDMADENAPASSALVGTQHTQRTRASEVLQRRQRQASRKKYLEVVTPRLEILQNMPFFIPFETRVQIFRSFVILDQKRRRNGFIDPDQWRLSLTRNPLFASDQQIFSKHHAKIRRESLFEDAFEQFYELGEGLKEPIQITFVDKFDTPEAGIDGGGVTKEFLTSVTSEAFSATNGFNLFVENDQHLLHPSPSAVDERKEFLREAGLTEGSPEWNEHIRDLLRRYEFLGRVIGKCLYEGILVDVEFAGFFLLKWALTGGSGSAAKESGYRANLNDLRDLDEGLYQGLLQLKNYPGNVEDFSLNFTVTDTISTPHAGSGATRTITRELKPNGANIPVTNENRLVYISYIARHRLQVQPRLQTSAFLRGLGSIIQPSWLSMFNQSELQTLVGGDSSEIDVTDLQKNTIYGGVYTIGDDGEEHPSVRLFWDAMRSFSDADRRKVLKFVTSTPRAPLLGFSQLNPRFSIRDAGADQDRLPSTSTCVNLLKLPRFSDEKVLREKLLYAVNSGAGFDLS